MKVISDQFGVWKECSNRGLILRIKVHHTPSYAVTMTFRIMIEKEVFNIGILTRPGKIVMMS
ncbi:hypothetical protein SNK12g_32050 [Lactiplantibacillus plantarum]